MRDRAFYQGVSILLGALVLIASSLALFYYQSNQNAQTQNQMYSGDISSLRGSLGSSVQGLNESLHLLADSMSSMNTSSPAYQEVSGRMASLWSLYVRLVSEDKAAGSLFHADLFIFYGNGTKAWYNDTLAQPGWNAYVATVVALDGKVKATWYPQFGEHFVTSINGVDQGPTNSWFLWERGSNGWALAPSGADGATIGNGTILAWTLCGYDASFNPVCGEGWPPT